LALRTLSLPERVLVVIDDSPTKRYGPKVEGADVHHNPTLGPADQPYLCGHIWVTISLALRHPQWGPLALPLRAMLYVRQQTMATIPEWRRWHRFATKLQLAARLVEWLVPLLKKAGKTVWVVVDGGYTKAPFLKRVLKLSGVNVVGRLRKDAALRDVPPKLRKGQRRGRGRPRKYGKHAISLAKRAGQQRGWQTIECTVYGQTTTKLYKTFLATYRPVGGVIRVVLVKEDHGWYAFYCTDLTASVQEIIEAFADRVTIEQDFHNVKEVWETGQQQVRNIWTNLAVYNLNLWTHTMVELWAWSRSAAQLVDRSDSPWDDPERRPSHANRQKALRAQIMRTELSTITASWSLPKKSFDWPKDSSPWLLNKPNSALSAKRPFGRFAESAEKDQPIIYCNPAFERLTGYSKAEVVGQNYRLLQAEDRKQDSVRALLAAVAERRECTAIVRNYCKDGRMFWNEVSISPVHDPNGRLTHFVGFQNDITDRVEAEWNLRESENRFRTIFEQAAVGVALIETKSGRFVRVNQKYAEMMGYSTQEMPQLTFMDITYPDDLEADLANMERLHAGDISEFSREKRLIRKDGSPLWIHLTVSPTWQPGKEPRFHIAIVQDIQQRNRAEERLRASEQSLAKAQ
jgi:PAS domain S-box-containing protein